MSIWAVKLLERRVKRLERLVIFLMSQQAAELDPGFKFHRSCEILKIEPEDMDELLGKFHGIKPPDP